MGVEGPGGSESPDDGLGERLERIAKFGPFGECALGGGVRGGGPRRLLFRLGVPSTESYYAHWMKGEAGVSLQFVAGFGAGLGWPTFGPGLSFRSVRSGGNRDLPGG